MKRKRIHRRARRARREENREKREKEREKREKKAGKMLDIHDKSDGPECNHAIMAKLTETIIGAAIAVHRHLGPGLLESTYEACLAYELASRGLKVERQKELPVLYRNVRIDCGYRIDLLVADHVILELKAVDELLSIHEAQLLSYLKLSGYKVGLLINFNVRVLTRGLKRFVNSY